MLKFERNGSVEWRDKFPNPVVNLRLYLNPVHWEILPYADYDPYVINVGWLMFELEIVASPSIDELIGKEED